MSASPALIICAAMFTQFRPEPHTTLTVTAVVSIGSPAPIEAWRATFCPNPAWITHPMYTWSTASFGTPALFSASSITIEPSLGAGVVLSAPPILPIAVRHAPAKTIFLDMNISSFYSI